jgi:hypothetical protein
VAENGAKSGAEKKAPRISETFAGLPGKAHLHATRNNLAFSPGLHYTLPVASPTTHNETATTPGSVG